MNEDLKKLIQEVAAPCGFKVIVCPSDFYECVNLIFTGEFCEGCNHSFKVEMNGNDPQNLIDNIENYYIENAPEEAGLDIWLFFLGINHLLQGLKGREEELVQLAKRPYTVRITEYLTKDVKIMALNNDNAYEVVEGMVEREEVVLSDNDFITRDIEVL